MSWLSFWNGAHTLYAGDKHLQAHYALIARNIIGFIPTPKATVLDFGCGEALSAPNVAQHCGHLTLVEASDYIRNRVAQRCAGSANISVMGLEALQAVPDGGIDLVILNSVLQYLTDDETRETLAFASRVLKPNGQLIVADILPPNLSVEADTRALLAFAAREGFLVQALFGLVRTAFSSYMQVRQAIGLKHYTEAEMLNLLQSCGFSAQRLPNNMGFNHNRMAFCATVAA